MQASEFNALLAPGNSIRLTSSDEPQLNVTIELDWMGETIIPLCGKQIMRGMTLKEAHSSISQCLKKYFKNTQNFDLKIVVPPQYSVKVGWRNESTSIVKVPADTSINSILARTGHAPSRETIIRLLSPYGLDIVLPAAASEWTKPFSWRGGESLILEVPVPEKTHYFVDVLGEVKKPGKISYKPAQSILSIIKQAHGLTTTADQDSVVIVRTTTGKKISTRWDDQNTKIEPGDVVYVPAQRESGFEKGLRWTGSILAVINTFFIVMLARKG
ncbi:MAG: Capsule biosynthesis GfcC [Pseudomonadota bacterium]